MSHVTSGRDLALSAFKFRHALIKEGRHTLFEITGATTGTLQARFELKLLFLGVGQALANGRFQMAIGFRGARGQMRSSGLPLAGKFLSSNGLPDHAHLAGLPRIDLIGK